MEHRDKFKELLEQCNNNFEEAYAITTKKLSEYYSLKTRTKGQWKEIEMWERVKNMIACIIADNYVAIKGYIIKCINGAYPYFEKERKEEEHGTDFSSTNK